MDSIPRESAKTSSSGGFTILFLLIYPGLSNKISEYLIDPNCYYIELLVKLWDSLPGDILMASSTEGFRRGLDRFVEERFITGHGN